MSNSDATKRAMAIQLPEGLAITLHEFAFRKKQSKITVIIDALNQYFESKKISVTRGEQ